MFRVWTGFGLGFGLTIHLNFNECILFYIRKKIDIKNCGTFFHNCIKCELILFYFVFQLKCITVLVLDLGLGFGFWSSGSDLVQYTPSNTLVGAKPQWNNVLYTIDTRPWYIRLQEKIPRATSLKVLNLYFKKWFTCS